MYFDHQVIRVDKYKTDELDSILRSWGKNGYKLVSTELAENRYGGCDYVSIFHKRNTRVKKEMGAIPSFFQKRKFRRNSSKKYFS